MHGKIYRKYFQVNVAAQPISS